MLILECSQECYAVKIWLGDIDLWPTTLKINRFQTLLRTKYVPTLVKIHWRMLILECSQGCYAVQIWPLDLWLWKSIWFQILLRIKYVPSLVKIHWRMLILECSQGCYAVKIWPADLDLWPWKSIGFQILLRTKYVPSLVKIHWRMLILECSQGCYGRTDGRKRYYIPSQLRWRGDNNAVFNRISSRCLTCLYKFEFIRMINTCMFNKVKCICWKTTVSHKLVIIDSNKLMTYLFWSPIKIINFFRCLWLTGIKPVSDMIFLSQE